MQVARVRKAAGKTGHAAAEPPAPVIADAAGLRRRLVRWYARAKRDLPWRRSRDPYAVWVSEVMLQQTQVERVKEFYRRFMARFPTVRELATAREADVLKHWEGLGYYRRARQLHAAAQAVVADHAAEFPRTVAGLLGLPGIGRYTAGAIASIAFDLPAPIVEANSRRVLARLAGHDEPVGGTGDKPIWELAAAVVPRKGAGVFNQALMDLGAMVCTPDRPLCGGCPLAGDCVAHAAGRVAARRPAAGGACTRAAWRRCRHVKDRGVGTDHGVGRRRTVSGHGVFCCAVFHRVVRVRAFFFSC